MTLPSLTYTRCPQPTAQYGHTERATESAVSVRAVSVLDHSDRAAAPRPSGSSPVSCRYTGQPSVQLRIPMSLIPTQDILANHAAARSEPVGTARQPGGESVAGRLAQFGTPSPLAGS